MREREPLEAERAEIDVTGKAPAEVEAEVKKDDPPKEPPPPPPGSPGDKGA